MTAISKGKLSDDVIDEIKRRVAGGELREGDKLPNQHEFAAQLGVSRTVLREALHTLALQGVIEQRPKYGTVIRDRAPVLYAMNRTPALISDLEATSELIEARRFIEVGAVELAVRRATEDEIRKMGRLVEEMARLVAEGDHVAYTELNVAFHFLIAQASHNRFMANLLATIRSFMEQWMHESISVLPGLLERSLRSHRGIYEAIRERDRGKAVFRIKKHFFDFEKSVKRYHEQMGLTGSDLDSSVLTASPTRRKRRGPRTGEKDAE